MTTVANTNAKTHDIIIIGSGIAGLYSAYNIKKYSPDYSFLILEQYKKNWIGGRIGNEDFYGTQVVTGAGIGRKDTNHLLIKLLRELNIPFSAFTSVISYSHLFEPIDIVKVIDKLKVEYKKHPELHNKTFKNFFIKLLGKKLYNQFRISAGYTDYENADIAETLYNYGMDDNKGGWTALHIPWKMLVDVLYHIIGKEHFRFSTSVVNINKIRENPCLFEITSKNKDVYYANKVIIATTITGIKSLVPRASYKNSIYQQIHGQPFLILYAKFDDKSNEIMKKYVPNYTIVPGPLQKIIPINSNKGVYMIAYNDNDNALLLKNNLQNTIENRELYSDLIEQSLGIQKSGVKLKIIAIKDFYWPVGTHYYEPLKKDFKNRDEFVNQAQNPQNGMVVVGEVVSRYQGWVEGALESVNAVITKNWVKKECL